MPTSLPVTRYCRPLKCFASGHVPPQPGTEGACAPDAADGRKSINGLAAIVEQALGLDPFAPAVHVFYNRRRARIKLLLWDRTGFWLMFKRLEADRFA
ncbi:IS66 family insertion sequence element accessory protein TnpB [Glaciimonas sp. CA11.2]|uniref:IS66 family insertion sequence element accessory protein TnpB n=1 Tax=Glaciimonas sp. CA11.2 TaxID=3048601 RepID=UPI002AB4678A|nr:IS66 family insertion sequence element accessory protein TnpB [Glaciimonas sp. CA11.2]MDY7546739.1 IS66 family insertion sequence element accessory protein TnpB [Glaciimonas sp. CA11.2]MEB0162886.1 IS66 family insertion sequence element accessory protein TnpB [Glaciimonas sp. CA11.2]